jgi:hypothetical protein
MGLDPVIGSFLPLCPSGAERVGVRGGISVRVIAPISHRHSPPLPNPLRPEGQRGNTPFDMRPQPNPIVL